MAEGLVRRAHCRRRVAVDMNNLVSGGNAAAGTPQGSCHVCRVLDVAIENRARRNALMTNGGKLAACVCAESDCLYRGRLMSGHRVHLRPRKLNANRLSEYFCDNRG